jgi:hypothetical protein
VHVVLTRNAMKLLLKQPLGNAMDLQEAVNGQLFFDNEDDMAGVGAGYGAVRTWRRNTFRFGSISRAKLILSLVRFAHRQARTELRLWLRLEDLLEAPYPLAPVIVVQTLVPSHLTSSPARSDPSLILNPAATDSIMAPRLTPCIRLLLLESIKGLEAPRLFTILEPPPCNRVRRSSRAR